MSVAVGACGLAALNIHHASRGHPVLLGANLSLVPGEIVSLLGANGAGKSTLLRVMLGLLRPVTGAVQLDGRDLRELGRRDLARRLPRREDRSIADIV